MRATLAARCRIAAAVAGAVLVLGGCASLSRSDDAVLPPWRVAEVISVGPSSAWEKPLTRDCKTASSATRDDSVFAVLLYRDGLRHVRRMGTARVLVADGLRVGDRVQFDPVDCRVEKTPRAL
jgi:hypothetical protein